MARISTRISKANLQRLKDYSELTGYPAIVDDILTEWL